MKALYFEQHGEIENLRYGEIPDPTPGPDEVLVRVRACALNHLDLWVLRGWPGLKLEMPHVGGADIAGVVVTKGSEVNGWEPGTRVVLCPGFSSVEDEYTARGEDSLSPGYRIFGESCRGGLADYVCAKASCLHEIPDDFSFEEAAAPLLVGLTAWRMLLVRAGLQHGETVLIVGAGGGLNSFALQLAKHFGARVIALTSSAEKMERVAFLGADHIINYREHPDWSREVYRLTDKRGADIVIDNVGQASIERSLRAAARGGRIVTVGNTSGFSLQFDNRLVFAKQLSYLGSTMGSRSNFEELLQLLWARKLRSVIDRCLPLDAGAEAYALLERGEQFGKVVLTPERQS